MISAKKCKAFVVFLSVFFLAPVAMGISAGEKAPAFKVVSGSDEILDSSMLSGRAAVIFYETKETKEKNRLLKNELNALYDTYSPESQKKIMRLAIIRCSQFMPNIWRRNLRENSKKEGMTIYGDWDGSMATRYHMVDNESNVLIVDDTGVVRFVGSGVIPPQDFENIKKIIQALVNRT
ncbi:MAG: hypothetical protein PHS37_06480 [Candidatus Omnitrophica bacterium]|nr:hypothetical protein [Candidatus Omnitrophota bacterium]